ncbi:unnamed protein product [Umbelopsis ramanniana]
MVKKLSTIATVTSSTFAEKTFEVPDLKPFEVYVKIRACGVCHTDLYALGNKDVVAGHETVGEIVEMGSMVVNLKPGDIVGFGYLKGACFNCEQCTSGNEILCPARVLFPTGYGGFAHDTVFDSRFCYKIPEGIEPKYAGPLMCAGATVFTAMTNYDVKPTDRIGIVGIGGLGHLGLQFARAWGCHVVAISTNSAKTDEAKSFGAHEFWNSKEFSAEKAASLNKLDFILNTVSGDLPWDQYLQLLKPNGTMINVGVPEKPLSFPGSSLILNQLRVTGSLVASRHQNGKMLEFAERHNIRPKIEEYPMTAEGTTEAVASVAQNKARYRAVLVAE